MLASLGLMIKLMTMATTIEEGALMAILRVII